MTRATFRRSGLTALLLALSFISCDHAGPAQDPVAPTESVGEPQQLLGLFEPRTVRARDEDGVIREYELVREPILNLDLSDLRVSQVIGLEGGTLTLLGHTLTVPRGAVDEPALFTLLVLPSGYVSVELTALTGSLLGGLIDLGSGGFLTPVQVELSYSRARGVEDPDDLVILRMNPRGLRYVHQALPSDTDESTRTVEAWLDHFSAYCMAQ